MVDKVTYEPIGPGKFMEANESDKSKYRILGRLHAPFFDLNGPTRNGRDYSEAAADALKSDEFKEKIENRCFFGRLGHPMTDEEAVEDPAVRACVIMSDYSLNKDTNMYEATLDILDNQYGQQLKSLIDAGARMGVSTRGNGESYEAFDSEVIRKGTYEFEALDVVTMPAVKAARCTVMEGVDKTQYKKIESLINDSNDKYVLESLKVTVESSGLPNKSQLLESINKKLESNSNVEVGTIESMATDIMNLTNKLSEAEAKIAEKDEEIKELKSSNESAETIEDKKDNLSESTKKLAKFLQSSTKVIESMKMMLNQKDEELNQLKMASQSYNESIAELNGKLEQLESENESLKSANESMTKTNSGLLEQVKSLKEGMTNNATETKRFQESVSSKDAKIKSLNESIANKDSKISLLESKNKSLNKDLVEIKGKYVESLASAYGISLDELKSRVNESMQCKDIESAAKSMRESADRRELALPDITELGRIVDPASSVPSLDDPELGRAGRIANLTKTV